MIRALTLWLMLAAPVAAQDMPALFDVTDVAADDVLNVRSDPEATAPILGALAPDARGVEVVALGGDGRWGQVNLAERAGWVSMAFLRAQPAADTLPTAFSCFGTEPFWSFDVQQRGQSVLTEAGDKPRRFSTRALFAGAGRRDSYALTAPGLVLTLRRAACNDGMSDRQYGLTADLVIARERRLLSGCCTLQAGQ